MDNNYTGCIILITGVLITCLGILLNVSLLTPMPIKLQASLSERVIVDGHGCHTALHFGVKA